MSYDRSNTDQDFEDHDRRISKLEMIILGIDDDSNGLRTQVRNHEVFIEQIKPQLQDLLRSAKGIDEIKDSVKKILIVLITSALIAVGAKFIQIKNGAEALSQINEIKQEQVEKAKVEKTKTEKVK